jgi:hypothetical protein
MIVATRVEFSLQTRKFRASAKYMSIVQLQAETLPNTIACLDRKFRIAPRHIIFNLLGGR